MASGGAGEAIEVTPREISVSLDGDRAEVSVQASGPSCGSYRLLVAAYGGDGRMLRAGASSIQFSQSTQTFSVDLEGCAEAVEYRAFFLAGDDSFRPVSQAIRTADRGQVSVNITRPHVTKGNHWHHSKNEKFIVVSGRGVIRFRDVRDPEAKVIEYPVSGDRIEVIDVPTGYTHNFENLGDTDMVTFIWCNECFDPQRPDTYSDPV